MKTCSGDYVVAEATFGVVTEFEFRLHQIGTTAVLIDNTFDITEAPSAMRRWRDLLGDQIPAQATPIAWVGTIADSPDGQSQVRNRTVASLGFVWVGDPDEGRRLSLWLTGSAYPSPSGWRNCPTCGCKVSTTRCTAQARHRRYFKGHYLSELRDEAIDAFLSQGELDPGADRSQLPNGSFQGYGGAIAATSNEDSAFSHRNALVEFVAATRWTDAAEDGERMAAARRYGAVLEPYASGVYVNVLADEGERGVRRAYPADKLAGSPLSSGATTRTTSSTSTRTSDRVHRQRR